MFEKHIYSDAFFGFIKDVYKCLQLPDVTQTNYYAIHPQHSTLSEETKENLTNLIQILSKLVFYLLAKSEDNNVFINSFII